MIFQVRSNAHPQELPAVVEEKWQHAYFQTRRHTEKKGPFCRHMETSSSNVVVNVEIQKLKIHTQRHIQCQQYIIIDLLGSAQLPGSKSH